MQTYVMWAGIAQLVQRPATGWTVRGSNPGGGEIFRTRPDRPWGPPNLLYNVYRIYFSGLGVDHPSHLVPMLKKVQSCTSTLFQGEFYLYLLYTCHVFLTLMCDVVLRARRWSKMTDTRNCTKQENSRFIRRRVGSLFLNDPLTRGDFFIKQSHYRPGQAVRVLEG